MTDAEQFLAAIIAEPDDDLPRLVFADWLEEHGEPDRAEFIRVQCALAGDTVPRDERDAMIARSRELELRHRDAWKVPHVPGRQEFRRGFVEFLRIGTEDFLRHQQIFGREAPITRLRVSTAPQHVPDVAGVPWLSRLRGLEIANTDVGYRLRHIFTPNRFPELRSLTLQNDRLWADHVATLASLADSWPKLRRLDLSGNPFSDDGVNHLAASAVMSRIRELVLRSDGLPFHDCVHPVGAVALGRFPFMADLEHLNLAGHRVGDAGFQALVTSASLAGFVTLDLSQNGIGEVGSTWAEALVDGTRLPRLKGLNLSRNRIDHLAAAEIGEWPLFQRGGIVDLRECEITDRAEAVLQGSPFRRQLLLEHGDGA